MRIPRITLKGEPKKKSFAVRYIARKFKKGYIAWQEKKKKEQMGGISGGTFIYQPTIYAPYSRKEIGKGGGLGGGGKEVTKEVHIEKEGVEIPTRYAGGGGAISAEDRELLRQINISYYLIPRFPKRGDTIFAYANIRWDSNLGELIYSVIEPKLTQRDREIIEFVKKELEERLDVDFIKLGEVRAKSVLRAEILRILNTVPDVQTDESKKSTLLYYMEKEIMGLGKIETLMSDPNIEDISCDGIGIPIYVYHRDPQIGSLKTNIMFSDGDELNTFAFRLSQKCRKVISIAEPLLDGALPDGSRVQATLGTDIARKGSNFTIRKFTEEPLTPSHMLRKGTLNSTQIAYLWLAIDNGQSVLISGGTATGKTSLLNALSLFIRPNLKVVSIEDTAELRLPHPHWIPEVARTALSSEGKKGRGEVSLFDLLKSSLRQRPDYIIMGEVRGKEAFVLFQQMATGHPSLATIHAASIEQLIDRLTTPPISLPPSLIENINVIVFLTLSRLRESYVRRTDAILEVVGIKDNKPVTNMVFEWKPITDTFEISQKSFVLKSLAKRMGISEETIKDELMRRKMILEWMLEQEIYDYREVAKIVSEYYSNPDKVMDMVETAA
ncbi:MAG: type II/IV secretion system ATPase subunit [Candidatus Aenigmarchaeota archaeon]|nr:type II/IV secretion system ATPase subunit [Candidatus Aenigmarchaeota archaeon]